MLPPAMSYVPKHVEQWVWTKISIDDGALIDFEQNVNDIKESFKEIVYIDRQAIEFFKRSTTAKVDWCSQYWKAYPKITIRHDFTQMVDDYSVILPSRVVKLGLDWVVPFASNEINQRDLFPKETLTIRREITKFIQACLNHKTEYKKLKRLPLISHIEEFQLVLLPFDEKLTRSQNLLHTPPKLEIHREPDDIYLDENLTEYSWIEEKGTHIVEEQKKIRIESEFQMEIVPIFESFVTPNEVDSRIWNFDGRFMEGNAYSKDLEKITLEEGLDKGVIYKFDLPYMRNVPSFKEPLSAYELTMRKPICEIKISITPEIRVDLGLKLSDEKRYMEEEVVPITHLSNQSYDSKLSIIRSSEPFILVDNSEIATTLVTKDKLVAPDEEVDNTLSNLTYTQNSNLEMIDKNQGPVKDSKGMINISNSSIDSNIATRMDTLNSKRTIDDDLQDIICKKRQKKEKIADDYSLPIMKLLRNNDYLNETEESRGTERVAEHVPQETDMLVDPNILNCRNSIIINSAKLTKNRRIMKQLDSKFSLKVIEYELDESDPDFIISSTCSILIIDSCSISQVDSDSQPLFYRQLIENCVKYKELFVIITLTEQFKAFEQLLNFQLMASLINTHPMIISSFTEEISYEIAKIAGAQAVDSKEIHEIESLEVAFLSSCGLNPFSSVKILQTMSITQFMTLKSSERDKLDNISPELLEYISNLFTLTWNLD